MSEALDKAFSLADIEVQLFEEDITKFLELKLEC